jgi:hypothetical protein
MLETAPVTFMLSELWLLHSFIRHEQAQQEQWKLPPADLDLNDQIAFAIVACEDDHLPAYTLQITAHQLLCIDYWIRDEHKSMTGAKGKDILLKTFRARRALQGDLPLVDDTSSDVSYQQAKGASNAVTDSDPHPDAGS